jgi:hypothetical protein
MADTSLLSQISFGIQTPLKSLFPAAMGTFYILGELRIGKRGGLTDD